MKREIKIKKENAALIAASPELLKWAEFVVEYLESIGFDNPNDPEVSHSGLDELKKTIEKAKGPGDD
jgi:hypothetical protein